MYNMTNYNGFTGSLVTPRWLKMGCLDHLQPTLIFGIMILQSNHIQSLIICSKQKFQNGRIQMVTSCPNLDKFGSKFDMTFH